MLTTHLRIFLGVHRIGNMQKIVSFQHGVRLFHVVDREYYLPDGRHKYSFHVQDSANNFVFRYDNEPHWAELPNFPFHKHLSDSVEPSPEMTLEMVFVELETMLSP
ncbi:MAG: toxin-antitoxin system TumE family protein [Candidatus Kapaibacteriota bacterium]|jgi:hypothetical protein